MSIYFEAFLIIVPIILIWILFRYLIRLVKANESIADNLEEISLSLKDIVAAKKPGLDKEEAQE